MDMVLVLEGVGPGGAPDGHCFSAPTGLLTIQLQLAEDSPQWGGPVEFSMAEPRVDLNKINTTVTRAVSTFQVPAGWMDCYSIANRSSAPPGASMATVSEYRRSVRLRITLSPG
jgi:hypothetical protein